MSCDHDFPVRDGICQGCFLPLEYPTPEQASAAWQMLAERGAMAIGVADGERDVIAYAHLFHQLGVHKDTETRCTADCLPDVVARITGAQIVLVRRTVDGDDYIAMSDDPQIAALGRSPAHALRSFVRSWLLQENAKEGAL